METSLKFSSFTEHELRIFKLTRQTANLEDNTAIATFITLLVLSYRKLVHTSFSSFNSIFFEQYLSVSINLIFKVENL